jgi:hypothetical protein
MNLSVAKVEQLFRSHSCSIVQHMRQGNYTTHSGKNNLFEQVFNCSNCCNEMQGKHCKWKLYSDLYKFAMLGNARN